MSRLEERQAEMRERIATEPKAFRSHSVSPQALRRMPSLVLRSAQQRSAANLHVRKVFEGRKSPFALKPVPVSQAIEAKPEISGDKNLAAVDGLAPEMFMGREVKCCRHCHLNQFVTQNGMCRKCRHSLSPEPVPDIQPAIPSGKAKGEIADFGNLCDRVDMAFAVKMMRDMNGFSQNQLADRMETSRQYISKLENRKCIPLVESIEKLAIALHVTPYILVTIAEAACAA